MSRLPPLLAAAALLAVVTVAVVVVAGGREPTRAEQADAIARELRCPDCQALSVADSPTESAAEIRRQIDALVAQGATPDEVRAHFVDRYGEWILLAPAAPAAWLIPILVVLGATIALLAWLARVRLVTSAEPSDA